MAQSSRLQDLEKRFSDLETKLKPSPEKEAFSILHAIIHESRRQSSSSGRPATNGDGVSLEEIQNLYKAAPPMEGAAENRGLAPGTTAPDFSLPDAGGQRLSLADFRGRNIVLVFYPLDWSPACSDQLSLYQSELEEFENLDTQLVGISVDSIYSHGAWAAVRGISFPLLSDFHPKGEVARRYHVYRESDGFCERALYVIDPGRVIRYAYVSPELHKVPNIYDLFERLRQLNRDAAQAPAI
ncbi:MAG: peroxiredoxin [Rudaea sp.]